MRVANLPDYFEQEDFQKFFSKQIPNFKHSKMLPFQVGTLGGNVLIQTSDLTSIDKLLSLHGRKVGGYPLSCWLMGHEHLDTDDYNADFDQIFYEEEFKKAGLTTNTAKA